MPSLADGHSWREPWPVTTDQAICLQHGLIHEIHPRNPAVSPRRDSQPGQSGAAGCRATVRPSG